MCCSIEMTVLILCVLKKNVHFKKEIFEIVFLKIPGFRGQPLLSCQWWGY